MVTLRVFGEPLDLDGSAVVALTRQVADFGQFQTRLSDYTNKFTLPNTSKNRGLLGIEQYESGSDIPYTEQDCSLWFSGVNVVSNGKLIVEEVANDIKVAIRPGSSQLFDLIKTARLRDLNTGFTNNLWDQVIVTASQLADWTDGFTYAITDTGNQSNSVNVIQSRGLVPGVFEKYLIQRIAEQQGYTVDFPTDTLMNKFWMPIVDQKVGDTITGQVEWKTEKNSQFFNTPAFSTNSIFEMNFDVVAPWLDVWNQYYVASASRIRLPFRGAYTVRVKGTIVSTVNAVEVFVKYNAQYVGSSGLFNPVVSVFDFTFTFSVTEYNETLPFSDELSLEILTINGGSSPVSTGIFGLEFTCEQLIPIETNWHRPLEIGINLPNITQGDVYKDFGKKIGAIYLIDDATKVAKVVLIKDLLTNFANPYNWQSKVNANFTPIKRLSINGFAQILNFGWKEPSNYDYQLPVPNTQLPDSVDFIQSLFEVNVLSTIYQGQITCGLIPIWDADLQRLKLDGKPRMLLVNQVIQSTNFTDAIEGNDTTTRYNFATYDGLQWEQLYIAYYRDIFERIIELMASFEMEFMLDEFDVIDFDFSRPVYLNNPMGFYFVRAIKEFTGRETPTNVLLYRL